MSILDEFIRVSRSRPCLICGKRNWCLVELDSSGEPVRALVSSIDLLPTIADFAGIETPAGVEGRSLKGLLDGTQERIRDTVYAMYLKQEETRTLALRTESHKLIRRADRDVGELYDLESDPRELNDLALEQPETVQRLTDRLQAWFEQRPDRFPDADRGLKPEVAELLKKGGYLGEDD